MNTALPCFYTKIYGNIPVVDNAAVMKKTIIPPIIDPNTRVGALGFSASSSMKDSIKIGRMMAEILMYISPFVRNSKKNYIVLVFLLIKLNIYN